MSWLYKENVGRIYNPLDRLVLLGKKLSSIDLDVEFLTDEDRISIASIINLCDGAWHDFFGAELDKEAHIGCFSFSDINTDDVDLWSVALRSRVDNSYNDDDGEPTYCCLSNELSINGLLNNCYKAYNNGQYPFGLIHQVLEVCNDLSHVITRYSNSKVEIRFAKLLKTVRSIMGFCFSVISRHDEFAKAYLLHRISEVLYGGEYPYREDRWDFVTKFLVKGEMHSSIRSFMNESITLKDLGEIYRDLMTAKNMPYNEKIDYLPCARCVALLKILWGQQDHDGLFKAIPSKTFTDDAFNVLKEVSIKRLTSKTVNDPPVEDTSAENFERLDSDFGILGSCAIQEFRFAVKDVKQFEEDQTQKKKKSKPKKSVKKVKSKKNAKS